MSLSIGFDIGTCFSRTAVYKDGKAELVETSDGREMPSVVAFKDDGFVVGMDALNTAARLPGRTVLGTKRLIGESFKHTSVTGLSLPYLDSGDIIRFRMSCCGRQLRVNPAEVIAILLKKLKHNAEERLGMQVQQAVITVPAAFGNKKQALVLEAAQVAGFGNAHLIEEGAATALNYCAELGPNSPAHNVFVLSMGGGFTSVSAFHIQGGSVKGLGSAGSTFGGFDADTMLAQAVQKHFEDKHSVNCDMRAVARLRRECEAKKKELSTRNTVELFVDELVPKIDLSKKVTRTDVEQLILVQARQVMQQVAGECLAKSKLDLKDFKCVIVQGASAAGQFGSKLVEKLFPGMNIISRNSREAAVCGAAVHMAFLNCEQDTIIYSPASTLTRFDSAKGTDLLDLSEFDRNNSSHTVNEDVVWEWQFQDGSAPEELWKSFPSTAMDLLEGKFAEFASNMQEGAPAIFEIVIGKYRYTVDLSKMKQRNQETGKERSIRRMPRPLMDKHTVPEANEKEALIEEIRLLRSVCEKHLRVSEIWRRGTKRCFEAIDDPTLKDSAQKLLRQSSHEHRDGSICNVMQTATVVKVARIVATTLQKNYKHELEEEERERAPHGLLDPPVQALAHELFPHFELNAHVNEQLLMHGTPHTAIDTIIEQGFDVRLAHEKGLYGEGLYFAEQACKCHQYAHPNDEGVHCILLCRLFLGSPFKAVGRMLGTKRPPANMYGSIVAEVGIDNGFPERQCHREFILFEGRRIYPELAIYYTTEAPTCS